MKFLLLMIASGVLYRMGGSKRYNTLYRDIGCSLAIVLGLAMLYGWQWTYILVFGLSWGTLSTYRYGFPKSVDYTPDYYVLHGVMNGLACLPLLFSGVPIRGILTRTLVLLLLYGYLNARYNKKVWIFEADVIQEFFRGFLLIFTLVLL